MLEEVSARDLILTFVCGGFFIYFFLQGGHAGRVCFSLVIVAIPADAGAIPRETPLWRWNRFVVLFSFVYFFMIEIRLKKNENVKGKHVWL